MYLIDEILKFAIQDTPFIYAETATTHRMLVDTPGPCLCVTEPKTSNSPPPQIDAEVHRYEIRVRADAIYEAFNAIAEVYNKFVTEDSTIQLPNGMTCFVNNLTVPVEETPPDQQNRKTFVFTVLLINQRTI